jgi:hypothetical protein
VAIFAQVPLLVSALESVIIIVLIHTLNIVQVLLSLNPSGEKKILTGILQ